MSFILGGSGVITDPANAPIDVTANTAAPYYEGIPYQWSITNLDDYTTYTLSSTNGTITRSSATLTYTPSTGGAGGWTMNGRIISLTILTITNFLETMTGVTFRGDGVAIDASGNIFISGESNVTRTGLALAKFDSKGSLQWQRRLTPPTNASPFYRCALDSSSNVYAAGGGSNTALIAKYDTTGAIQVQNSYTDATYPTDARFLSVVTDSSNNVYACGRGNNTGVSRFEGFLMKLDSSLNITWQRKITDINWDVYAYGITTDTSGNVYVTGWYRWFPGTFILKYNSAGTLLFQCRYQGNTPIANNMLVDSSGNIYLCGTLSTGAGSLFVMKVNSTGVIQWQRNLSGAATNGYSLSLDSSNNIYVVGASTNTGNNEYVIAKYDNSGVIQWQRRLGTTGTADQANNVTVDTSGNIIVNGQIGTATTLLAKLPNDGSKTGTYTVGANTIVYAASTLTDAAGGDSLFTTDPLTSAASAFSAAALGGTDAALTATATRTAI